jgi:hypothetical protein
VGDDAFGSELATVAQHYQAMLVAARGFELETQLLEVIRDLLKRSSAPVSIKAIASTFVQRHGSQYDRRITNHWIGRIVRQKLHLATMKSNGNYIIPIET